MRGAIIINAEIRVEEGRHVSLSVSQRKDLAGAVFLPCRQVNAVASAVVADFQVAER